MRNGMRTLPSMAPQRVFSVPNVASAPISPVTEKITVIGMAQTSFPCRVFSGAVRGIPIIQGALSSIILSSIS